MAKIIFFHKVVGIPADFIRNTKIKSRVRFFSLGVTNISQAMVDMEEDDEEKKETGVKKRWKKKNVGGG